MNAKKLAREKADRIRDKRHKLEKRKELDKSFNSTEREKGNNNRRFITNPNAPMTMDRRHDGRERNRGELASENKGQDAGCDEEQKFSDHQRDVTTDKSTKYVETYQSSIEKRHLVDELESEKLKTDQLQLERSRLRKELEEARKVIADLKADSEKRHLMDDLASEKLKNELLELEGSRLKKELEEVHQTIGDLKAENESCKLELITCKAEAERRCREIVEKMQYPRTAEMVNRRGGVVGRLLSRIRISGCRSYKQNVDEKHWKNLMQELEDENNKLIDDLSNNKAKMTDFLKQEIRLNADLARVRIEDDKKEKELQILSKALEDVRGELEDETKEKNELKLIVEEYKLKMRQIEWIEENVFVAISAGKEEIKELKREVRSMKLANEQLKSELEQREKEIRVCERNFENDIAVLRADNNSLKDEIKEQEAKEWRLVSEKRNLIEKVKQLEVQNNIMEENCLRNQQKENGKVNDLERRCKDYQENISILKDKIGLLRKEMNDEKITKSTQRFLKSENLKVESEILKYKDLEKTVFERNEMIKVLQGKIEVMKDRAKKTKRTMKVLECNNEHFKALLEEKGEEQNDLAQEIGDKEDLAETLKYEINRVNDELGECRNIEKTVDDTYVSRHTDDSQMKVTKSGNREINRSRKDLKGNTESVNALHEKKVAEKNDLVEKLRDKGALVEALQYEIKRLLSEVKKYKRMEKIIDDQEKLIRNLKNEIKDIEPVKTLLDKKKGEQDALIQKLNDKESLVEALQNEIKKLHDEVVKCRNIQAIIDDKDRLIGSLKTKINHGESIKALLEEKKAEQCHLLGKLHDKEVLLEALQHNIKGLHEELEKYENMRKGFAQNNNMLIKTLKSQIKNMMNKNAKEIEKVSRGQNEDLKTLVEEKSVEHSDLLQKLCEKEQVITALQYEIKGLTEVLSTCIGNNLKVKDKFIETLTFEMRRVAVKADKADDLKYTLQQKNKHIDALENQIFVLNQQQKEVFESHNKTIIDLTLKEESSEDMIEKATHDLSKSAQVEKLKVESSELRKKNMSLRNENNELKREISKRDFKMEQIQLLISKSGCCGNNKKLFSSSICEHLADKTEQNSKALLGTIEESGHSTRDCEEKDKEIEFLREKVSSFKEYKKKTGIEREALKSSLMETEKELELKRDQCVNLTRKCQEHEKMLTELREKNKLLENKRAEVSSEAILSNKMLKSKLLDTEKQLGLEKEECAYLGQTCREYERKMKELSAKISSLETELARTGKELTLKKDECVQLEEKCHEQEQQLEEQQEEIDKTVSLYYEQIDETQILMEKEHEITLDRNEIEKKLQQLLKEKESLEKYISGQQGRSVFHL